MTKNLTTLIDQLNLDDQINLEHTIQKLYAVSLIPRDKIKEKLIGLMNLDLSWMETELTEDSKLDLLGLGRSDLIAFSKIIEEEFKIKTIPWNDIISWKTVKHIINHIELKI